MVLQQPCNYNQHTYNNINININMGKADLYTFNTDFNLASSNPIEYVYNLLKTSNIFENATDIYEE